MAIDILFDRELSVPLSAHEYKDLEGVWYALGGLWTILEETRHDNDSHVACLLRPIELDFGEVMEVIQKRFEAAKKAAKVGAA